MTSATSPFPCLPSSYLTSTWSSALWFDISTRWVPVRQGWELLSPSPPRAGWGQRLTPVGSTSALSAGALQGSCPSVLPLLPSQALTHPFPLSLAGQVMCRAASALPAPSQSHFPSYLMTPS